jgi:hypothetical protein
MLEHGESYREPTKVKFKKYTLYSLKDGKKEYLPIAFWLEEGVYLSKGAYTDVGEAFLLELGLPDPDAEIHNDFVKTGGKPRPN